MPKLDKQHIVNHSASQMFDLVADVEKYPEFLPLCSGLQVLSRREKQGRTILTADMTVAYKLLRETFTSQVILNSDDLQIDVKYIDGPFRYLDNRWKFSDLEKGKCEINFAIDYEFKSKMLGVVMGSMFEIAFGRFTTAFEERADKIYG
ncbi:MAG: type II toxin-antitoxin system RatA family toxin [Rhizobiaceae bacterium]|nr:type II toxin-antitoxin system RatA family toxin [Rhizobiaceae bacterium]